MNGGTLGLSNSSATFNNVQLDQVELAADNWSGHSNDSTLTFTGQNTLDGVIISDDSYVEFHDRTELEHSLTNNGHVYVSAAAILTFYSDSTIDGRGTMELDNGRIESINDAYNPNYPEEDDFVTIGGDQNVYLSGADSHLGNGHATLFNYGFIGGLDPDDPANSGSVDPNGFSTIPCLNRGTITGVKLSGGVTWDNQGGKLANVRLDNVTISGGAILDSVATPSGYYGYTGNTIVDSPSTLADLTIDATIDVNADLTLIGSITSQFGGGELDFHASDGTTPGGNLVLDEFQKDVVLDGISLVFEPGTGIVGTAANTLTIGSNASVSGIGTWTGGDNSPSIIVDGTMVLHALEGADATTIISAGTEMSTVAYDVETGVDPTGVDPAATTTLMSDLMITGPQDFTNAGILTSDTGTIDITNLLLNNAGGTIDAAARVTNTTISNTGGSVQATMFDGVMVTGGVLSSPNAIPLALANNPSTLIDVTSAAEIQSSGVDLTITGSLQLADDSNVGGEFINDNSISINGATLTANGNVTNHGVITIDNGGTLVVNAMLPDEA